MKKAPFFVFEGIDGSGKSTQISYLKQNIENTGMRCYVTKEPSDGPIGTLTRQFLTGRMQADEKALAALFVADRLDHLTNPVDGISKKIEEGIAVISDRYYLSNYAYNGVRVPLDWVKNANSLCKEVLKPDCHIFVDVTPEIALERISKNRFHTELYETKERLTEVRNAFLETFESLKNEETILIVDGNQTPEAIAEDILEGIKPFLQ